MPGSNIPAVNLVVLDRRKRGIEVSAGVLVSSKKQQSTAEIILFKNPICIKLIIINRAGMSFWWIPYIFDNLKAARDKKKKPWL